MAKKSSKPIPVRSDADRRVRQCERLARLFQLLRLITGSGKWDAAALAKELGCSKRTVHRLLQTLSLAGVPWFLDGHLKAYKVRSGFKLSHLESECNKQLHPMADEMADARRKLIADGERFAKSLDEFLKVLTLLEIES